jgi:hypothetical protein
MAAETAREPVPVEPPRFDIATQRAELLAYLDEHGYAVSAGVVPDAAVLTELRAEFWDFLESNPPDTTVRRSDPRTWTGRFWLPDPQNGIITGYGFGHADWLWRVRLLPRVHETFAAVWGTRDLICSFDGGNLFRPWKRHREWITDSGWWHVDQNARRGRMRQGKVCLSSFKEFEGERFGGLSLPRVHALVDAGC